ncbi:MAG: prenyltransferase/squalene oxidase repeat-containing protein [Candidatus Altiarchaeota archaeon]
MNGKTTALAILLLIGSASAENLTREQAAQAAVGWLISNQNQSTGEIRGGWIWDTCFGAVALSSFGELEYARLAASYILGEQSAGGNWAGPDETAVCMYGIMSTGLTMANMTQGNLTPISYLEDNMGSNGGITSWGVENIQSTSWVALGLNGAGQPIIENANKTPIDFIVSDQDTTTGGWTYFSTTYDSAVALLALSAWNVSKENATVASGISYLKQRQYSNGSFGSQYVTALAVLALESYNESLENATDYLIETMVNGSCAGSTTPTASATALCALALGGKSFGVPLQYHTVGMVVEYNDTLLTSCDRVPAGVSGKSIVNSSGISSAWIYFDSFGYSLDCLNGVCAEQWPGSYWHISNLDSSGWQALPVGLGHTNACWNGNYSDYIGHYCAADNNILGFIYHEPNEDYSISTPEHNYTISSDGVSCTVGRISLYSLNLTSGQAVTIRSSERNASIDVQVNESLANVNINVTSYDSNPTNSSLSASGLNKYVRVDHDSSLGNKIESVILRVHYTDIEISTEGMSEQQLRMWWYNQSDDDWQMLDSSNMSWVYSTGVNISDNFVWANVSHFSLYTIGQETETNLLQLASGWNLISIPLA